ncbi:MAG: zinc-ribbon domain-containing protein [Planctomycetes bacterium]|nr:zinc-ribbon domain-containing protein [Planctomycetota bacterium]
MTTERTPASCDSCGKLYRVPDPTKTYSCKACGGKVCAEVLAEEITCPECQASIADGDEFCTQCGVALAPENESAAAKDVVVRTSRARAKSKRSGKDREHDRAATRELTKAFKF